MKERHGAQLVNIAFKLAVCWFFFFGTISFLQLFNLLK